MDGKQSLLKTDVRGRVRTPVERREALLDEFERSGLGGPKFAALVGVKYQTFAGWVHERRKKGLVAPAAMPLRLVEAVVSAEPKKQSGVAGTAASILQVHLGGGVRLEIGDAAQVKLAAALLKALGQERSC
jgi:hypothetical protein